MTQQVQIVPLPFNGMRDLPEGWTLHSVTTIPGLALGNTMYGVLTREKIEEGQGQ
jgi:hypothetical protein